MVESIINSRYSLRMRESNDPSNFYEDEIELNLLQEQWRGLQRFMEVNLMEWIS